MVQIYRERDGYSRKALRKVTGGSTESETAYYWYCVGTVHVQSVPLSCKGVSIGFSHSRVVSVWLAILAASFSSTIVMDGSSG